MQSDLAALKTFHGHLGPYLVAGVRMGRHALKRLQATRHFGLEAEVWCPNGPPSSCLLDGIQFATGCTLGKGNIRHHIDDEIKALFRNRHTNQVIMLTFRAEALQAGMAELQRANDEAGAQYVYDLPDEVLLEELRGD
ncbi:MAG: formylmethanofuran dehydrogenase subunit E family protein [Armatimonadota bacterium]